MFKPGAYKAMILIWQLDLPDDRFRYVDVSVFVGSTQVYMPLVLK
jgi:hypothetical protein